MLTVLLVLSYITNVVDTQDIDDVIDDLDDSIFELDDDSSSTFQQQVHKTYPATYDKAKLLVYKKVDSGYELYPVC